MNCISSHSIQLARSATELGIINPVVCLFHHVEVQQAPYNTYDKEIKTLMEKVSSSSGSLLEQPQVQGFRQIFVNMGYEKVIPAGERLFKAVQEKGFKSIDSIVDAYNLVAIEAVAGLGMHDASRYLTASEPLTIWRSEGADKIIPLGKTKEEKVKRNDLVYGFRNRKNNEIIAWLGQRDKDSATWRVTEKTTSLLFVVLGNANTTQEYNEAICTKTFELLKKSCPQVEMKLLPIVGQTSSV